MAKDLIIIGASGHGKVVADIARQMAAMGMSRYEEICFLDDDTSIATCGRYPVIGMAKEAERFLNAADIFVAIGGTEIRREIMERLERMSAHIPVLIHPSAIMGEDVSIGRGSVIQAGAVIDPYVKVGKGCIINKCVNVSHDCVIGDYVHIAPGAHICGGVRIGSGSGIGAGATVVQGLRICEGCMVGAGAAVVSDIEEAGIYVGVPARQRAG